MPVEAVLIQQPAIDFTTLLTISGQALGHNIAREADTSHRKMADAEKFLSCLSALRDEVVAPTPNLLSHVSFSVLLIADNYDLLDILECASGMPFVRAETTAPQDIDLCVISGTLQQWRDAVATGTSESVSSNVRLCYSKILLLFDRVGLSNVWKDYEKRPSADHSGFYLEDKRRV